MNKKHTKNCLKTQKQPYFHLKTCCIENNNKYIPDKAVPGQFSSCDVHVCMYLYVPSPFNLFRGLSQAIIPHEITKEFFSDWTRRLSPCGRCSTCGALKRRSCFGLDKKAFRIGLMDCLRMEPYNQGEEVFWMGLVNRPRMEP